MTGTVWDRVFHGIRDGLNGRWIHENHRGIYTIPEVAERITRDIEAAQQCRDRGGDSDVLGVDLALGRARIADLHVRGVRIRRGDGSPLDAFDWHTASRA